MLAAAFLSDVFEKGRAFVPRDVLDPYRLETDGLEDALQQRDQLIREHSPAGLPPFNSQWAICGALTLFRLCQFLVFRDFSREDIQSCLAIPSRNLLTPPSDNEAAKAKALQPNSWKIQWPTNSCSTATGDATAHYNVDISLQFLPDVLRLGSIASPNDPLIESVRQLALLWPLSSVGIANLEAIDDSSILEHPALCRLYIDRIIAIRDKDRLQSSRIQALVRTSLGDHAQVLAPDFLPSETILSTKETS